jgi:hypothetical protein
MSAGTERPWVRMIGAIALTACGVAAAMVSLSCAKEKSLETQVMKAQTDQTQVDALRRQVAQLQATVAEKDAALKLKERPVQAVNSGIAGAADQKVALESVQPPASESQPAAKDQNQVPEASLDATSQRGFLFQLKSCALSGSTVQCELLITNKDIDRRFELSRDDLSRVIDAGGRESIAGAIELGAHGSDCCSVQADLPSGVPISGRLRFEGVKPGTKRLQLLEIAGSAQDAANSWHRVLVKFSNIAL